MLEMLQMPSFKLRTTPSMLQMRSSWPYKLLRLQIRSRTLDNVQNTALFALLRRLGCDNGERRCKAGTFRIWARFSPLPIVCATIGSTSAVGNIWVRNFGSPACDLAGGSLGTGLAKPLDRDMPDPRTVTRQECYIIGGLGLMRGVLSKIVLS